MATSLGEDSHHAIKVEDSNGVSGQVDPFALETPPAHPRPHRYSPFDTQLFASNHASSSPAEAKKALEAHLAETDRRIQETSKLGTSLVQQRVKLSQRLGEVGSQGQDSQISPELRQKLVEIEREYHEVGRQSARAFLGPKADVSGSGEGSNAPFALDGRVSYQSAEPIIIVLIRAFRILRVLPSSLVKLLIRHPRSMSRESNVTKLREQMT